MPTPEADLVALSQAKLDDARALLAGGRADGAAYLCGYAVELALKAAICRTLGWTGYPATRKEFEGYLSLKTHDLDVLLNFSGHYTDVLARASAEWRVVALWDPEMRYAPVGSKTATDAQAMIDATVTILGML